MEPAWEKMAKTIKIKLCRQDKDTNDLVRRMNPETTKEEVEEEPAETLQRRPRKRDIEQPGKGSGPKLDCTATTYSVVVEPRMEEEPEIRPKAVTMVQ